MAALPDPSAIGGAWAARRGPRRGGGVRAQAGERPAALGGYQRPSQQGGAPKLALRDGPVAALALTEGPAGIVDQEVARSLALLQSGCLPSGWRQQVTG